MQIVVLLAVANQVFACSSEPCAFDVLVVKHDHVALTKSDARDDLSMSKRQEDWAAERPFTPLGKSNHVTPALTRGGNQFLEANRQHQEWETARSWSPLSAKRIDDVLTANHDHLPLSRSAHEETNWRSTRFDSLERGAPTEPLSRCD